MAQTFFVDEKLSVKFRLDAVVTVIDAHHLQQHWEKKETQEQIAFADVLLLNKLDLVSRCVFCVKSSQPTNVFAFLFVGG